MKQYAVVFKALALADVRVAYDWPCRRPAKKEARGNSPDHLYVIEKVRNGLEAADTQGTIVQEEVEKQLGTE